MKKIDRNIKECPFCGNDEYYQKESFKGTSTFHSRFDGEEVENSNTNLYSNAIHKVTSKFAYCSICNKQLFKLDDILGDESQNDEI